MQFLKKNGALRSFDIWPFFKKNDLAQIIRGCPDKSEHHAEFSKFTTSPFLFSSRKISKPRFRVVNWNYCG